MEEQDLKYIDNCFNRIVEMYNFKRFVKINEGQDFMIEFQSKEFIISIESYRHQFFCTLFRNDDSKLKIGLFNLLDYLYRNPDNITKSDYFNDKKIILQSFQKQIMYLSDTIYDNYAVIFAFFNQDNLEVRIAEVREFIINKYPHLFKRNNTN